MLIADTKQEMTRLCGTVVRSNVVLGKIDQSFSQSHVHALIQSLT